MFTLLVSQQSTFETNNGLIRLILIMQNPDYMTSNGVYKNFMCIDLLHGNSLTTQKNVITDTY